VFGLALAMILSFYNVYLSASYQDKLEKICQNSLEQFATHIDNTLNQLDKIAYSILDNPILSPVYPFGNQQSRYLQMCEELKVYLNINPYLVDILYWKRNAEAAFTPFGTTNPNRYDGISAELWNQLLQEKPYFVNPDTFPLPWKRPSIDTVEYVVPSPRLNTVLIFSIQKKELFLYDDPTWDIGVVIRSPSTGHMIKYMTSGFALPDQVLQESIDQDAIVFNKLSKISGENLYLYSCPAETCDLIYYFFIPEYSVEKESYRLHNILINGVIFVSILGFVVIVVLAFCNYLPIHRVKLFALKQITGIPGDYSETDTLYYALQVFQQEKKKIFLQKLLSNALPYNSRVYDQAAEYGITLLNREIFVLLIEARTTQEPSFFKEIQECIQKELNGIAEVHYVPYIENISDVYLLSVRKEQVQETINVLSALSKGSIFVQGHCTINLGGPVTSWDRISTAFYQARVVASIEEGRRVAPFMCYNQISEDIQQICQIPITEIQDLYNSIKHKNRKRVGFLMDTLINSMEQTTSYFTAQSIFYNTVYTVALATREIGEEIQVTPLDESLFYKDGAFSLEVAINYLRELSSQLVGKDQIYHQEILELFEKIVRFIDNNIENPELTIPLICENFQIKKNTLNYIFQTLLNETAFEYISRAKHNHIKKLLLNTDLTVNEISHLMGYSQPSSFIRYFKNIEGVTPGTYREQARGRC